ncbi:MAG: glycosyltransferase family 4 protein [Gammaproteobacteria bacterium]
MTNVLFLYWGRKGGGVHYTAELLESDFSARNIRVFSSLSSSGDMRKFRRHCDLWQITYSGKLSFVLSSCLLPFYLIRLLLFIRRNNIQVVYVPMRHVWSPAINSFLHLCGVPVIHCVHDARPHPGDPNILWNFFLRWELRFSTAVVVLSNSVRQLLEERCGDMLRRKTIHLSTLPVFRGPRGEAGNAASPPRSTTNFVFFGRIAPYKGLDILVRAFSSLPYEQARLTIVGTGTLSDDLRSAIESDDRIHCRLAWLDESEISAILRAQDIMVLPYTEASQSGAVMSAFGAGLPVIASSVGGLAEQVRENVTGLVLDEPTSENLQRIMKQICEAPEIIVKLKEGVSDHVSHGVHWVSVVGRLADLFRQVGQGVQ